MPWKHTNFSPASGSEPEVELSRHPAVLVESFAKSVGGGACFELSYYKYFPQSLLDERRKIKIKAEELSASRVEELIDGLRDDEELAFHSSIIIGARKRFHLPLIDFCGRLNAESLDLMERLLGARFFEALTLYDSGRSFHGYVMKPLSTSEWVRFMGTLLLLNLPDRAPITDSRWVGHRLRAGYAALRWSKNTAQYALLPTRMSMEEIRTSHQNLG